MSLAEAKIPNSRCPLPAKVSAVRDSPRAPVPHSRKRTNSLGWAHSDCHTCSAQGCRCDRRRPRCGVCTSLGIVCGGYVQALHWQQGVASRGKLKGRQLTVDSDVTVTTEHCIAKPSSFLFVQECRQGRRNSAVIHKPKSEARAHSAPVNVAKRKTDKGDYSRGPSAENGKSTKYAAARSASTFFGQNVMLPVVLHQAMSRLCPLPSDIADLLSFYKWRFSRTTITCDVQVNPWQSCLPMVSSNQCLMSAVTALSRRHRSHCLDLPEELEVLKLKDHALSEFSSALGSTPCEAMIATTLALIGLEYADTGFSNWTIHLRGAYLILESSGGLRYASTSSTLRSHIAMLNWWDITASLLSREGPVFPSSYVGTIATWRKEHPGEWSNLSLNGCPDALLLAMYDIAAAAPKANKLGRDDVHMLEVRVLDGSVPDADEEVDVNTGCPVTVSTDGAADMSSPGFYMSSNLYLSPTGRKPCPTLNSSSDGLTNLVQCWRSAMILYIRQVFLRPEHSETHKTPVSGEGAKVEETKARERRSLSEDIMNLVSSMPMESNWQKQCLLPVVLAGFELRCSGNFGSRGKMDDITNIHTNNRREWIRDYCQRWKLLTGLWVFGTAIDLLNQLWVAMDMEAINLHSAPAVPAFVYGKRPPDDCNSAFDCASKRSTTNSMYTPRRRVWWGDIVSPLSLTSSRLAASDLNRNGNEGLDENGYLFG